MLKEYTKLVFFIAISCYLSALHAQPNSGISTHTPESSAILDLSANTNKALMISKVHLLSKHDVTTINNPANGLIVYATHDSGSGTDQILKDNLYKFNGVKWVRLSSKTKFKEKFDNLDIIKVVAFGSNTEPQRCLGITSAYYNLTTLNGPISQNGSFTAPKNGFYSYSSKITVYNDAQPSQAFSSAPYIYGKDLGLISFIYRGNNKQNRNVSMSGTVYLLQGQSTEGFQWHVGSFGNNSCDTNDRILSQIVIWEYLGNPL